MATLALLSLAGCALDELDLEGRQCPCVEGWVCDTSTNTCVQDEAPDAGESGMDAGVRADAGPPVETDAGPSPPDAGPAPPSDAGPPPDAGPPAPPSRCVPGDLGDALFCDSFESGDGSGFDGPIVASTSDTFEYVTAPVYRGSYAMRATAARDSTYALLGANPFAGMSATDLYFRAYYYWPSTEEMSMEFHYMGTSMSYANPLVTTVSGEVIRNFHTHGALGGGINRSVSESVPLDQWHCVGYHVHVDATAGFIELWVDGAVAGREAMIDTTITPALDWIGVGVAWKSAGEVARSIYVDEVVADTSPIGCD